MNKTNTRKALNPAYRKHKPLRKDVTHFTSQLVGCIEAVKLSDDNGEHEEHTKQHYINFFKSTFYKENYVNTKDRIDLAIYIDATANSDVGVIIEAKKPSNKSEFLTESNLNRKALQELLLYYLRERLDNENNNIKHLIATNGYEWYLFKAEDFYNYFYKNKALVKEYKAFRDGLKDTTKNELFYNEIAKKYIAEVEQELPFVHLDFTKTNFDKLKDAHLNTLYKIFSDVHLLGHAFGNDSNQLNRSFYNELLHIIGLEEVKQKGKKIISRKAEKNRDYASLLESTIFHLEDRDYLHKISSIENSDDKAFNAGLELCLTWVNRILFLKLLESQLLSYHDKNPIYKFLNSSFIDGYDDLNDLFFSALAKKEEDRHPRFKDKYSHIPYLNSSLFERSDLEDEAFEISALNNDKIEIYKSTVLKDNNGKKATGKLNTLDYLFQFLDAYDFATDGTEGIEDAKETKSLINASVLGLIFEKINGYKEGSFYTPAYITMYMCRETLRRAVIQKFQEQENDEIASFEDLQAYCRRYFKTADLQRFNNIINSLRICDPAVGSGHFLVSALNELIVIKNELGILVDAKGHTLRCDIEIVNDELYVLDDKGLLFEYKPNETESKRIQHTLFHEKQTLIENCLFGVDINPNSVKICRLRLWIELLKNAYYTTGNRLQTLPNIDINIKCGNSLISRFNLVDDLKGAFRNKKNRNLKYTFTDYKNAVAGYKSANTKERKREVLEIIEEVKNNFQSTLTSSINSDIDKAKNTLYLKEEQLKNLEQFGEKVTAKDKANVKKLKNELKKAILVKDEIINNVIYRNAFEWRFEFPEVLADDGSYIGFDAIIGNPPYFVFEGENSELNVLKHYKSDKRFKSSVGGKLNAYKLFLSLAPKLLKFEGYNCQIVQISLLGDNQAKKLRKYYLSEQSIVTISAFPERDDVNRRVFEEAKMSVCILLSQNKISDSFFSLKISYERNIEVENIYLNREIIESIDSSIYSIPIADKPNIELLKKFYSNKSKIKDTYKCYQGELNISSHKKFFTNKYNDYLLLKGAQIQKYYTTLNPSQGTLEYVRYADYIRNVNSPKSKHHNFERIVMQGITGVNEKNRLKVAVSNEKEFCGHSTNYIVLKEEFTDHKFILLALLNSALYNWAFKITSTNSNVNSYEIESLPFPKELNYENVVSKVTHILKLKNQNPESNTTVLEQEIDQMVYKLYDLTEEEIQIVENS